MAQQLYLSGLISILFSPLTGCFESPAYDPALFSNETLLTFRHNTMNLSGNVLDTLQFDPQEQYRDLSDWIAPDSRFAWAIIIDDLLGSFVALMIFRTALDESSWTLSEALFEEAEVTAMKTESSRNFTTICEPQNRILKWTTQQK
jgi:hypothetical protein